MSLLRDYEERTAWKYEPIRGAFPTERGLTLKVGPDGKIIPFPGVTTVFRPDKTGLELAELIQRRLYDRLQGTGMLADMLPSSTIHMTLHDLLAANRETSGRERKECLQSAAAAVEGIRRDFAGRAVTLLPDRIVSMMSTSLVLMLRPESEGDFELLMDMYRRFDGIVSLPYPLTPHITLAYYRPGMLDGDALGQAVDALQVRPGAAPVLRFFPEGLTAQVFLDMARYEDVPRRVCFCCDGGLNRSVMAAAILNHEAERRGLPVRGEARSAFPGTQGMPVPNKVWDTLKAHGIDAGRQPAAAKYLETEEAAFFTCFAGISFGAMERISWMGLPKERFEPATQSLYGVPDPQFGEISYEEAFTDLQGRVLRWLDDYEKEIAPYLDIVRE